MAETEQAGRVLSAITFSMEQGKEFVVEQAPEVVQRFIAWQRVELTSYCVIAAIALVIGLIAVRRLPRCADLDAGPVAFGRATVHITGAILGVVFGAVFLITNLSPTLQVWIAPKVYLLEYVARLAT